MSVYHQIQIRCFNWYTRWRLALAAGSDLEIFFYLSGIDTDRVHILPGIMPIQSYAGFTKMTGFCKTKVPQRILDELELVKDDDAKAQITINSNNIFVKCLCRYRF